MFLNYTKGIIATMVVAPLLLMSPAAAAADKTPGAGYSGEKGKVDAGLVTTSYANGTFQPFEPSQVATTYNQRLVPRGARVSVSALATSAGRTIVRMEVHGLVPNREYGAHAHVDPCGPQPADPGPHYQHVQAPPGVSGDPDYANPENEIWLDFTTDARGDATVRTTVNWQFSERHAQSVVIHDHHTLTKPGYAGAAGARLACVNVPF